MVAGMGMRTIWISLRALNYTDRAFQAAIGNLKNLTKQERENLKTALKMMEMGRFQIQAGMLYGAMLGMVGGQLFALMSQTKVGSGYMREFTKSIEDTKVAFADTFFEVLKPVLDVVRGFLNLIKQNAPLRTAVVILAMVSMALMGVYAASLVLSGIYKHMTAQMTINNFIRAKGVLIKFKAAMANITLAASNHALATSLVAVGISAGVAFALFFALKDILGPLPAGIIAVAAAIAVLAAILWSAAAAVAILTVGVAAGLGAAAFASAVDQSKAVGGFAGGTRGLSHTGMFFGHKGEVIYNPATDRPTGIGGKGEQVTHISNQFDFSGTTINTKADNEELVPLIKRTVRDAMLDKD